MWRNIVESGRPRMTIWRMRTAWWRSNSTNIHSQYAILIFSHCVNSSRITPQCYAILALLSCFRAPTRPPAHTHTHGHTHTHTRTRTRTHTRRLRISDRDTSSDLINKPAVYIKRREVFMNIWHPLTDRQHYALCLSVTDLSGLSHSCKTETLASSLQALRTWRNCVQASSYSS